MMLRILMLIFLVSCSSIPQGEPQLKKMIQEDQANSFTVESENLNQGRPVFIKATAWPQVLEGGDITDKSIILIMVGREKLSIEKILKNRKELKDASSNSNKKKK